MSLIDNVQIKLFTFFDEKHPLRYVQKSLRQKVSALPADKLKVLLSPDRCLENFGRLKSDRQVGELALLLSLIKNEQGFWNGGMINLFNVTKENAKLGNWLILTMILRTGAGFTTPKIIETCDCLVECKGSKSEVSVIEPVREILLQVPPADMESVIKTIVKKLSAEVLIDLLPDLLKKRDIYQIAEMSFANLDFLRFLIRSEAKKLLSEGSKIKVLDRAVAEQNTELTAFILNTYNRRYKIERPSTSEITPAKNAAEAFSLFNSVAQNRGVKFSSNVLSSDISRGREETCIRVVNEVDSAIPTDWHYASVSKPLHDLQVSFAWLLVF